jgi:hypothetical protein
MKFEASLKWNFKSEKSEIEKAAQEKAGNQIAGKKVVRIIAEAGCLQDCLRINFV